jgi:hypothetical protein
MGGKIKGAGAPTNPTEMTGKPAAQTYKHLASSGFGDHSAAVSSPVEDLTRKIDPKPQPDAFGMESSRLRQPAGALGNISPSVVPDTLIDNEAPLPSNVKS